MPWLPRTDREIPLYGAILLPPLAVAVTDPDIFFAALDTAGTFGISLLCGVLPAAMAWQQRYGRGVDGKIATLPLVPGGKATLAGDTIRDLQQVRGAGHVTARDRNGMSELPLLLL